MLKKSFYLLFLLLACNGFLLFSDDSCSHYVIVSVAPHKFFVEKIAGDTLKVGVMVPAGSSAHTFEPSPKQMVAASHADIWFRIGESFETKIISALQSHNPKMKLVDLRQNLDLISDSHCCSHNHSHESSLDLHFWLSPKLAKQQVNTITEALIQTYPEHTDEYKDRQIKFLNELDELDSQIRLIFETPHNSMIMVSHPAYAYFCKDYGCQQLPIEFEGKDPTPQQLTKILAQAKEHCIKKIFIQMQYNSKGARLIASHIGAEIIILDPYSENYLKSLIEIAKAFAS